MVENLRPRAEGLLSVTPGAIPAIAPGLPTLLNFLPLEAVDEFRHPE